jgi:hypothetical protein
MVCAPVSRRVLDGHSKRQADAYSAHVTFLCCAGKAAKAGDEEEGGAAAKPLAETADIPVASNGHADAADVITGQHPSGTAQRLQATRAAAAQVLHQRTNGTLHVGC